MAISIPMVPYASNKGNREKKMEEISTGDIGSLSRNKCLQDWSYPQPLWYNTMDLWGGSSLS